MLILLEKKNNSDDFNKCPTIKPSEIFMVQYTT